MKKTARLLLITVFSLGLFFLAADFFKLYVQTTPPYVGFGRFEKNYVSAPSYKPPRDLISYKGENGKTALEILQTREHALLEYGASGLLVSINGRKANSENKEYWAFYVNGKMASVGPAEYITQDTDVIEWKIEKY